MKILGFAGLTPVLCLAFALPVLGQQAAPPSAEERACDSKYTKYYNAQSDMVLFDDFENDATCKDSKYRESGFQLMAGALAKGQKFKEMLDLEARFAKEFAASKNPYVYQAAFLAASSLRNADKIIEIGEKVLTLVPDDLSATVGVATTIPVKLPTDPAAMEKALNRSLELAKKLLVMMKPANLDDKVWQTQVLGPAHGIVGFVHLQRKQNQEALDEFMTATKIDPKDQMSWYRGGIASYNITLIAQGPVKEAYEAANAVRVPGPERDAVVEKRDAIEKEFKDKRAKAIDILLTAVALPDANIAKAAKDNYLAVLWKSAHSDATDPLEGLDAAIAMRKAELKS